MDSKSAIEAKQEGRFAVRGFKGPRPEPLRFGIDGNIVIAHCERKAANQSEDAVPLSRFVIETKSSLSQVDCTVAWYPQPDARSLGGSFVAR